MHPITLYEVARSIQDDIERQVTSGRAVPRGRSLDEPLVLARSIAAGVVLLLIAVALF